MADDQQQRLDRRRSIAHEIEQRRPIGADRCRSLELDSRAEVIASRSTPSSVSRTRAAGLASTRSKLHLSPLELAADAAAPPSARARSAAGRNRRDRDRPSSTWRAAGWPVVSFDQSPTGAGRRRQAAARPARSPRRAARGGPARRAGRPDSSRDGIAADRITNSPRSPCAPDQPAERLRQPRADDAIVIGAAAAGHAPRRVKHGRPRPRHALHHHQPQRFARHVDAVAQRVGAEQRRARIVAEDVDQRPGIDRVDMLREQRQPCARQPVGDPRMHRLQPLDGGEQPERPAPRRLDQPRIGARPARRCRPA